MEYVDSDLATATLDTTEAVLASLRGATDPSRFRAAFRLHLLPRAPGRFVGRNADDGRPRHRGCRHR